jgi:hypothetical protein
LYALFNCGATDTGVSLKSLSSAERFFLWGLGYPGIKVFETNESQMILEPSFKFAGNPNIILAVKAFGLKATVQVCAANGFQDLFSGQ